MSSSTKILVGLVSGAFVGLCFGEQAGVFKIAADGFVKPLQMMVLASITISIIASLGTLGFDNTWIELKRRDGTIDALFGHWILGKQTVKRQARWSIIHNVLHWSD